MREPMSRLATALASLASLASLGGLGALTLVAFPVAWLSLAAQGPSSSDSGLALTLSVLSSRADMVTGGDAVIRVGGGGGWSQYTVSVNGKPASLKNQFRSGPGSVSQGLLTGLPVGKSTVEVKTAALKASIEVTNYPITGPVFSGPHQKPFVCQTDVWDLGAPLDENCSAAAKVAWMYKSTAPAQGRGASPFKPFGIGARPADLAETTVNGRKVPYIVRVETGTINRAVYQIAVLHDPTSGRPPRIWCLPGGTAGSSTPSAAVAWRAINRATIPEA